MSLLSQCPVSSVASFIGSSVGSRKVLAPTVAKPHCKDLAVVCPRTVHRTSSGSCIKFTSWNLGALYAEAVLEICS